MRVKAPAEKNFRRARARPARRRKLRALVSWRAVRALLVVALVGIAGYRVSKLAYDSSLFRVRQVRVHGNLRVSPGEVQAIVGELKGAHILTANLVRSRAALLESPWLADAALRRVLPSTIDVYVSERRPFGICRQASQLYLVAADGTLIDEFGPKYAAFDLPIIDGLFPLQAASRASPLQAASRVSRAQAASRASPIPAASRVPPARAASRVLRRARAGQPGPPKADPARAALAARVVDAIQGADELARRVSQIDVSNVHDAVVILDGDPALLHVGEERFRERLLSYLEIADALRERIPDIDYVDLRFEQRIYVKPRGRAEGTAMQLPAAGKTF